MAVTAKAYGLFLQSALNKEIDWDTDTIKAMLVTSTYTPNQDTHRYVSSITGEAAGTGYTAGGQTLTGKTLVYTTGTNTLTLSADSPTWTGTTLSGVRYIVFYVDTGTGATSPLISYMDFGSDQATTAQPFVVTVPSSGLVTLTAA